MSADFKSMLESLLGQKPELSPEYLRELIDEKKRKVGAGYLTDQGALFLVAADLGISLISSPRTYGSIKDLFVGAKDVNVVGRILSIYPTRKFYRRDTNEELRNRTLTIYDHQSAVRVKLWDHHINSPDESDFRPGQLIKISRAYVKSGFDGRPVINLSSNSHIETLQERNTSIPDIDAITLNVGEVHETRENVVITGIVESSPSISQYQNPRGEMSKLLRLQLSDEMKSRSLRTVVWNIDESRVPRIFDIDAKVRLVGVKIRQGNPKYGSNDLEIHGDEGSTLEVLGSDKEIEARTLKVVSFGRELGNGTVACLALARNGKFVRLIIASPLLTSALASDSMIECVPSRILGNSIILSEEDSFVRIIDEDPSFPKISMFESKIKDIHMSDSPYILEAIVLQSPNITEVNTKNGELVNVSDTLIGDDTAEIRLVGWREESHSISRLAVGDRIRVLGARANQGMGGKMELALKPESSLIKVN